MARTVGFKGGGQLLLHGSGVLGGGLEPLVYVEAGNCVLLVVAVVASAVRVLDEVLRRHAAVHGLGSVQKRHLGRLKLNQRQLRVTQRQLRFNKLQLADSISTS